ncbi:MAG: 6-carboxytetrahydropterin synthase [bacterium]
MRVTRVERVEAVARDEDGRWIPLSFDLEATLAGDVSSEHGMVVNLTDVKKQLRERVVERLNGRRLDGSDADAPELPTAEKLAQGIWDLLGGKLADRPLVRIRLVAARSPIVTWTGEEMRVTRSYEFSAAHRLHAASLSDTENVLVFGKCNNPAGHGHNYVLEVTLAGRTGHAGELLPADVFDRIVESEVVDRWDHKHLNEDLPEFAGINPTAEEIARVAWRRLTAPLARATDEAGTGARLARIELHETARNRVEYEGEDE